MSPRVADVIARHNRDDMADAVVETLILDLVRWLTERDRSYEEVMDAWRTSCPRLPIWEDANDRGLVKREDVNGRCVIKVTSSGQALLAHAGFEGAAHAD
jgi:hypothetical protein